MSVPQGISVSAGLSGTQLAELARDCGPESGKLSELALIFQGYETLLAGTGMDPSDRLELAAAPLGDAPAPGAAAARGGARSGAPAVAVTTVFCAILSVMSVPAATEAVPLMTVTVNSVAAELLTNLVSPQSARWQV